MMSVDVLHIEGSEFVRERSAHQGVAQGTKAESRRTVPLPKQGPQDAPEMVTSGAGTPRCAQELIVRERVKIERLLPKSALRQAEIGWRNTLAAAADHLRPSPPQFGDLIDDIRFERRRKFVGNVGDGGHKKESSDAQSIP